MNYELQTLYSTNQAFNCDVIISDKEQYMGRLYVLTTEDSILQNLGIKSEWFLAHQEADVLISGHINREGKWSLSSYRNLEPSFEYTTRNQIFEQVFSPDYVWELAHLREELISNISQFTNNSGSSSNEDNAINKKDVAVITEQLSITPENINALRDLIIHSFSDELVTLEQELEIEMHNNHLYNEQQSAVNTTNITEIMNYFQREAAPKLDENELFHAQIYLTERIMDEYERQNIDEFVFKPFGIVTINVEESCCSLRDEEDGHTIFTATFDADIIHGLGDIDAAKIEMILHQFDREDFRRARNAMEEERSVNEADRSEIKQQKGIDYGA
ncbi:hypothetical protein IQ247_30400 [Plectonema cf. radiosum LEGE 06105]|uniref:Uncharacterized protein n=1 Tax=Plectonema cf. radiosum LEGE 06105 TaxID=945769 RepID=A0A8J7K8B1_9CYAN|nr:hypothetical protein [Plectonema radiosum]MBE9216912.1 hypothetical protein [Plectonema cf. radiosum LEGE 06105]